MNGGTRGRGTSRKMTEGDGLEESQLVEASVKGDNGVRVGIKADNLRWR